MRKKKSGTKNSNDIFIIDCDEDVDEDGFSEKEVSAGKVFASFNFSGAPAPIEPEVHREINAEVSNTINAQVLNRADGEVSNKLNVQFPTKLNGEASNKINAEILNKSNIDITDKLIDNRTLQTKPYGITPPVDGEHFNVRRTFLFRRSTVRMLNRLKAEHEDENVYLSSLVDEALRFYYKYIFENNKPENKKTS